MKNHNKISRQSGQILIALTITVPALILIVASYLTLSLSSFRAAKHDQFQTHAQLSADAGVDLALKEINVDPDYAGTSGETEIHNDGLIRTTFDVVVDSSNPNTKIVTSTGRSYSPTTSATAGSTVSLKVPLRPVQSGTYSIISGQGGLFLSNSAKITGGDVFINGEVELKNSAQIGLSTNPVNLEVAHQNCPEPADATYPQLCNDGENGQPISILNTAHIYGSVKANNQTDGSGMSDPGLVASSGVSAKALPSHDRNAQKAAITTTITGSSASCSGSETRTWAANTKITGNVTIKNSCVVGVQGDIWITGKLEVENTTQVVVADSLGSTRPNVMIDGSSGAFFKNSAKLKSNASSTGFQIITYFSKASCSPDCADVTGQDLYNSRSENTIQLDNSANGPETIFYARWTRVQIANSGQIGALVGQTIELKNSGTITFGSATGTGDTFWVINGYRRTYN